MGCNTGHSGGLWQWWPWSWCSCCLGMMPHKPSGSRVSVHRHLWAAPFFEVLPAGTCLFLTQPRKTRRGHLQSEWTSLPRLWPVDPPQLWPLVRLASQMWTMGSFLTFPAGLGRWVAPRPASQMGPLPQPHPLCAAWLGTELVQPWVIHDQFLQGRALTYSALSFVFLT